MNKYFKVEGQKKLNGTIHVSGAKNSVLALIIGATMTDQVVTIEDVPDIRDVHMLKTILEYLGANVIISTQGRKKILIVDNKEAGYKDLLIDEITAFRASYYFMGAMIARYKKCRLLLPGGCFLGPRPIDLHIKGFEALGCDVKQYEEGANTVIEITVQGELEGKNIFLDFPSVGATINLMLAASMAKGETLIENAAKEPEIVDVATLLNNMGANVTGAGTNEIRIEGAQELSGCFHQVVPDRIEAGTYLMMASLLGEDVTVNNIIPEHLDGLISKLTEIGIDLEVKPESVIVHGRKDVLKPVSIKTGVYPSFATDLQQVFLTLLTQVEGESTVIETIYPDRFRNCAYLNDMGAKIEVEKNEIYGKALIQGGYDLTAKDVMATDLRAGAALIFAGMLAEGTTTVNNITHVLRGYDSIVDKLRGIGAEIELIEEEE